MLQGIRNDGVDAARTQPYIYQHFNVVLYFTSAASRVHSLMARIVNAAIEGLNSKERLPKYLLIILDKDLLQELNYFEFGLTEALEECLFWLVKQFDKVFEIHRDDLRRKKPGALSTATEPWIIWLAMLQ